MRRNEDQQVDRVDNFIYFFNRDNKHHRSGRSKGQALGEYAVILLLAIGAFTVMQVYVRRELQGRLRDASDKAVSDIRQAAKHTGLSELQYEPYYAVSDVTTETASKGNAVYSPGGRNDEVIDETIQREGTQVQYPYNYDAAAGGPE